MIQNNTEQRCALDKTLKILGGIAITLVVIMVILFVLFPVMLFRSCEKDSERHDEELDHFYELLRGKDEGAENYYALYNDRIKGQDYVYELQEGFYEAYRALGTVVVDESGGGCIDCIADGDVVYFLQYLPLYNGGMEFFLCRTRLFSEQTDILYRQTEEKREGSGFFSAEGDEVFLYIGESAILFDGASAQAVQVWTGESVDFFSLGEGFVWFEDEEAGCGFLRAEEGTIAQYESLLKCPDYVRNGVAVDEGADTYAAQDIVAGTLLDESEAAARTRYRRLTDDRWLDMQAEGICVVDSEGALVATFDTEYCLQNSERLLELSTFKTKYGLTSTEVLDVFPAAAAAFGDEIYLWVKIRYDNSAPFGSEERCSSVLFAVGEGDALIAVADGMESEYDHDVEGILSQVWHKEERAPAATA